MKRYTLLLTAIVLLLVLPAPSHAQSETQSLICDQIKSLTPVSSHYTQRVLTRANDGLAHAQSASVMADFILSLSSWTRVVSSSAAQVVDTTLRLNNQQQDLLHHSACLRVDMLLLECKMAEVQEEMYTQLERGSSLGIWRLQSLQRFLNERLRHLEKGAVDPLYIDPTWGFSYLFDPPGNVWCHNPKNGAACESMSSAQCAETKGMAFFSQAQCDARSGKKSPATADAEPNMCPFNADYAPPFWNGFGCDLETMASRVAYVPLKNERDALKIVMDEIEKYQQQSQEYIRLQQELENALGLGGSTEASSSGQSGPPPERKHLVAYGCAWSGGYCSDDHSMQCINDSTCEDADKGTCEQPTKVCEENRIIRCFEDADCSGAGSCIEDTIGPPASRSLRGQFSLNKDHLGILTEFLGVRATQELSREFSTELKLPSEEKDPAKREQLEKKLRNIFERSARLGERLIRRTWSRLQGRQESGIFPQAVDAQLQIAHDLVPIRDAVSRLAKLASDKQGLREFVVRYAYFLRRTCADRSCNRVLDQILKLVLEDECFPYTDGKFLDDSEDNPRWQRCRDAAKISQ